MSFGDIFSGAATGWLDSGMNPYGAAIGAFGGFLGGDAMSTQTDAANRAAAMAAFNPWNVSTGIGGVNFDPSTHTATTNLNPQYSNIANTALGYAPDYFSQGAVGSPLFNQSRQFLSSLNSDPYSLAADQYAKLNAIIAPQQDQQRTALENHLLSQGRLGSTGGSLQQQALETAFGNQNNSNLAQALNTAMGWRQQNYGIGAGLTGMLSGYQNMGNNALNTATSLENIPIGYMNQGGQLGAYGTRAGAFGGNFLVNAANNVSDSRAAMASGIFSGLSNYTWPGTNGALQTTNPNASNFNWDAVANW